MTEAHKTPSFNMKVVVQETGIKSDTLRAWERRYGIPDPHRTEGGHRLYSQYEIDMLKWLLDRQDEGLSISNAVDLWQQITGRGDDPFLLYSSSQFEIEPEPVVTVSGEIIAEVRQEWVASCLAFDEQRAHRSLIQAFARFPVETVCVEVLQKGLSHIGRAWYEGDVSVQQEHFTSALATRQLEALIAATAAPTQNVRLLITCPPKEHHTFSPLMLTLMFKRRGWDVVYLGANVPLARLEATVERVQPQLVIAAAQTLVAAGTLYNMAQFLYNLSLPLAFGGLVFTHYDDLHKRIPGHYLQPDLKAVPQAVSKLLHTRTAVTAVSPPPPAYQQALNHFVPRVPLIESTMLQKVRNTDDLNGQLMQTNEDLVDNIIAALTLGDMNLLTPNIEWVEVLLANRNYALPHEVLTTYLRTFYEALQTHLDEQGKPILDWFERTLQNMQQSPSTSDT